MFYPQNFEKKTGFDTIRNSLKMLCINIQAKENIDNIYFSTDFEEIVYQQNLADEMMKILLENTAVPLEILDDLRRSFADTHIAGTFLTENEVCAVKQTLENLAELIKFFLNKTTEFFPNLVKISSEIQLFPKILTEINKILDKTGQIKDNASTELMQIRNSIFHTNSSVLRTLQSILNQAQTNGIVEKDATPALRNGRLVIPVASMNKRKIDGIIHDESATGKTAYIEPTAVVLLNNRLRELQNEEKREIARILIEFTNFIRPYYTDIQHNIKFIAKIDALCAIAKYSLKIKAVRPYLRNEPCIFWHDARHPLLQNLLEKQNKKIVPLTVSLDKNNHILIISGPNAGGKSVCIKTIALLQYMLQCGLPVPFSESSQAGIFQNVFIDIGDGQNFENDLSTYSSHLQNLKFFLKNGNEKTLIVIDEFGTGTEPQMGGAIAQATLQELCKNNVFCLITTHYTNLKHFASSTQGVQNGAMLYDRATMQPLFVLQTGAPGSSFAIEIAKNIGLPVRVIETAEQLIGTEQLNFDKNFQSAARDKRYWENKRIEIRQKEKEVEQMLANYEQIIYDIEHEKKEILRQAKIDAKAIINNSNALIENTIREIKEANAEKEATKSARKNIEKFVETISERNVGKQKNHTFSVGNFVTIKGQNAVGQLIELNQNNAIVIFGSMRTQVRIEKLEYVSKSQAKKSVQAQISKSVQSEIRHRQLNFSQEIDLRGMRVFEAIEQVKYFIDDAQISNVQRVRILHGTGEGALRQAIRKYLTTCPQIKSFADENVQLGGAGVTIVEF
jgi:DNA mismatch repair protein MutS2